MRIFDPAMLDTPHIDDAFKAQQDERTWKVSVKRRNQLSTVTFPFNPLDAVGWHGDLSVGAHQLARHPPGDEPPLSSAAVGAHAPSWPTASWSAPSCRGRSRAIPEALKVPFFHNNDDFDEVIFYHEGSFFSRDNIHPGMMTLHPVGFTHGPHPKAFDAAERQAAARPRPTRSR